MGILISAAILFSVIACNQPDKATTVLSKTDSASTNAFPAQSSLTYAYKPSYAVDFEMGNPKYAQAVMQLWKDFDSNNLDNSKDFFADSVAMEFPNGNTLNGTRDSIVATAKKMRSAFKNVTSEVETFVTLKPKDKDETWFAYGEKKLGKWPMAKRIQIM